jgi:tetratricopeptide (TPR) repeat protein
MRFWIAAPLIYAGTVAGGLVIPATIAFMHHPSLLRVGSLYALALVILAGAAFTLTLMAARLLFPSYWWLGQVMGQDVYELQGVYFIGIRLTRVPARLQRLVFGADEKFRRWDIAFGLIWLLLILIHGLAASTSRREIEGMLPKPVRLPETLNLALLSDLPVMRAQRLPWSTDQGLMRKFQEEAERLQAISGKTEGDWFKLAQLHLLRAYKIRKGPGDAYTFTPMDRIYFERGIGAQSADYLNQILAIPEAKRAHITRGTLTLLGFFHLCEYNYEKADRALADALTRTNAPDESGISMTWTRLLAAQVALQLGSPEKAIKLLNDVMADSKLPEKMQALAMEHLAEAKRQNGEAKDVGPLLDKAAALYAALGDGGGQARISLRRSVWLSDQGGTRDGAEELSQASMLAETSGDVFAQNSVVRVTHLLPALR